MKKFFSNLRNRLFITIVISSTICVIILFLRNIYSYDKSTDLTHTGFKYSLIDARGPADPWGKSVGDINGDGLVDLIVGGHGSQELVWYENPSWQKRTIATQQDFSTDHEVVDVDKDGRHDVVSLTKTALLWYKNPEWSATVIDSQTFHDVEVGDFDQDGDVDLVARDQSAFGGIGERLYFYQQHAPRIWEKLVIPCPPGEGLKVADINGDGKLDVVVNGKWYENTGEFSQRGWRERTYSTSWAWPHTFIDVGDINGDGRLDIVLAPAESAGQTYRISWFEAPLDPDTVWREHVLDATVEAVHHFVGAADMDNDGDVDIVSAEMHQGEDDDEVKIYVNRGAGAAWSKTLLARTGSHSMRLVDIDNDGDTDVFGANWSGAHQSIELWKNVAAAPRPPSRDTPMPQTPGANRAETRPTRVSAHGTPSGRNKLSLDRWQRHIVDAERPWRAVFITAADLDGDGKQDIVTGGWWYMNPGRAGASWKRTPLGTPLHNMAAVYDFDGDGDQDVLGTAGKGSEANAQLVWARNNGRGVFTILHNIARAQGDFLQGVAVAPFSGSGTPEVALAWHEAGQGVQLLTVPTYPDVGRWSWHRISHTSQDEQLSAGDINRDGLPDLLLGTKWLCNGCLPPARQANVLHRLFGTNRPHWGVQTLSHTEGNPDRNRLADMNGDGRLDAVVGFEAISIPGKLVWYEQPLVATEVWAEHPIATVVGPMSLDVIDMDGDHDLDVVVGEHNLKEPANAKLYVFENTDGNGTAWASHLVAVGDEHHDGAVTVDIDGDGDRDILSVGWGHNRVLLYENKAIRAPVDVNEGRDDDAQHTAG